MPWVPIEDSSVAFSYSDFGNTMMADSIVSKGAGTGGSEWEIYVDGEGFMFRVTVLEYANGHPNAEFIWYDEDGGQHYRGNEDPSGDTFSPSSFTGTVGSGHHIYYYSAPQEVRQEQYMFLIEVREGSALVANDDEATTNVDTPVTVDVLANDTLGGAPVELSDLIGPPVITVEPEEGEVVVEGDGSITYSPPEGFSGEVTFEYEIETEEDQGCVEFGFASCSANDEINEGPLQTIQAEAPWLDYMAPFTITTPEWEADYEWGGTSALKFFETGTTPDLNSVGSGTLTQNGNSICVEWFAGCA